MKFKETKYDIGDVFYKMSQNKIVQYDIIGIEIYCDKYYNEKEFYRLYDNLNKCSVGCSAIPVERLEKEYHRTKKDLMLSMFPNEFKDGLIVK